MINTELSEEESTILLTELVIRISALEQIISKKNIATEGEMAAEIISCMRKLQEKINEQKTVEA